MVEEWIQKSYLLRSPAYCTHRKNVLSFEELLELNRSFKNHNRNIQSLAIELFKIKNNLLVTIVNNLM